MTKKNSWCDRKWLRKLNGPTQLSKQEICMLYLWEKRAMKSVNAVNGPTKMNEAKICLKLIFEYNEISDILILCYDRSYEIDKQSKGRLSIRAKKKL